MRFAEQTRSGGRHHVKTSQGNQESLPMPRAAVGWQNCETKSVAAQAIADSGGEDPRAGRRRA